jgi:hypothetical protein
MRVCPASDRDIHHVCIHMREHNAHECFNTRYHRSPYLLAQEIIANRKTALAQLCLMDAVGEPVAILGAYRTAPQVAVLQMIATDRWGEIAFAAYRMFRTIFIPHVLAPNVRVAMTAVLANGSDRSFLLRAGFLELAPALPLGNNGELYVQVAWVKQAKASEERAA